MLDFESDMPIIQQTLLYCGRTNTVHTRSRLCGYIMIYIYPRSPKDILKMVVPVKDIFYTKDIFYKGHFPEFKILAIHAHPWVAPLF